MKKVVIPGLAAGAGMFLASMLMGIILGQAFPSTMKEYNNFFIFRPWKDPLMQLFYVHPFLVGLILAWVWEKIKKIVKGKGTAKGVNFGLTYFLIVVPGMLMSYSTFKISLLMVTTWTISVLVQALVAGIILAKTNK
jgi:hypothetical protein